MNKKEYMSELCKINSEMMKLKLEKKRIFNEYVSNSDIGKEFKIGDIVKITGDDIKPILGYVKDYEINSQYDVKLILCKVNKQGKPYNTRLWVSDDDKIEKFLQVENK